MLRPVRTVGVTTKEEQDAALATADQITVEGDDELLSYAAGKAASDPENRVTVEIGDHAVYVAATAPSPIPPTGSVKGVSGAVAQRISQTTVMRALKIEMQLNTRPEN